jgi:catechol 2,3-dioxygenase-like lactoylglutathione lyase family enzyme
MIDHIGLQVSDYQTSKAFYLQALQPLGYDLVREIDDWGGFGSNNVPELWLIAGHPTQPIVHLALRARERKIVDAFHAAAIAAGGTDNGAPGIRIYHPNYYAAFVLDPDGHNLEVVCHQPE